MEKQNINIYFKSQLNYKEMALRSLSVGAKEKALSEFSVHLEQWPDDFDALHLSGVLLFELGQHHHGLGLMDKASSFQTTPYFHNNHGNMLLHMGWHELAAQAYRLAMAADASYAEAQSNYANLLLQDGLYAAASEYYTKAISLKPGLADAWANRGIAQYHLKNISAAEADLKQAIAINPQQENYFCAYADLCLETQRISEANALLQLAFALNSNSTVVRNTQGRLHLVLGESKQALENFIAAVRTDPLDANAYRNAAIASYHLGDTLGSQKLLKEALQLDQQNPELWWLDCFMHIPASITSEEEGLLVRRTLRKRLARFQRLPERGLLAASCIGNVGPFYLMYHGLNDKDAYVQYGAVCSDLLEDKYRNLVHTADGPRTVRLSQGERVRICLVSAQIKEHSMWNSHLDGLYRRLDPLRFELYTINLTGSETPQSAIARQHSAEYAEFPHASDEQVLQHIASLRPDVMLYPEVGLHAQTMRLATLRLAHQQVAMWGNPETTGLKTIDYFISIAEIEKDDAQSRYSEKLVKIPLAEHYYARGPKVVEKIDPQKWGLDKAMKVVLCPGTAFKYQQRFIDFFKKAWENLDGVQFVFFKQETAISQALQEKLSAIESSSECNNRLVFLPWLAEDEYYALMRHADAMLDGLNFSGFNTAIKAIECELPIISLSSVYLRENFSAGLLQTIGCSDVVAGNLDEALLQLLSVLDSKIASSSIKDKMRASKDILFDRLGAMPSFENFILSVVLHD